MVRARFWADLEIFLNVGGLRVYFKETEGLLCKSGSADRFPRSLTRAGNESGPLDLHRAVRSVGRETAVVRVAGA